MRWLLLVPAMCIYYAAAAPMFPLRSFIIPSPPVYTQCNSSWASDPMGVDGPGERSTICGEGCAMTSVAMALASLGIKATWSVLLCNHALPFFSNEPFGSGLMEN